MGLPNKTHWVFGHVPRFFNPDMFSLWFVTICNCSSCSCCFSQFRIVVSICFVRWASVFWISAILHIGVFLLPYQYDLRQTNSRSYKSRNHLSVSVHVSEMKDVLSASKEVIFSRVCVCSFAVKSCKQASRQIYGEIFLEVSRGPRNKALVVIWSRFTSF